MASALASPPPPFPFGSSDLKRNARVFFERALVISALVHLAGAGLFRAAERRLATSEEEIPTVLRWNDPTILTSRIKIFSPTPPSGTPSTKGVFVPTDRIDFPKSTPFDPGPVAFPSDGIPEEKGQATMDRGNPSGGPPQAETSGPFTFAEILPVPISTPLPAYPEWARDALIEGKVVVRVLVGIDGLPKKVEAISGSSALTGAAVEGVWKWKFRPGLTSGRPVQVWVEVPVVFTLQ